MSNTKSLDDVPEEILQDIVSLIDEQKTLHSLSLTSKRISRVVLPMLYRTFSHRMFQRPARLHCFLRNIIRNADLAKRTLRVELLNPIKTDSFWDLDSWKAWARMNYLRNVPQPDQQQFLGASEMLHVQRAQYKKYIIEQEEAQAALLLCLTKNVTYLKIENPVAAATQSRFRMDHLTLDLLQPQIKLGNVLQRLEELCVTTNKMKSGQGGFRLSAISTFFQLPCLRRFTAMLCHEPEDMEFAGFDCPSSTSNVTEIIIERSGICPTALSLMLDACKRLEGFECDWAGVAVGWVEISFPLLGQALYKHREDLQRIKLNTNKHFDSWPEHDEGLVAPLGSLKDFTVLTRLEAPASALIGWDEDGFGNFDGLQDGLPPSIEDLKINRIAPRLYEHISALADVCAERYPKLSRITIYDDDPNDDLESDIKDRFEIVDGNVQIVIKDGDELGHFV